MTDWQDISTAPEWVEVQTKIDDNGSVRKVQRLMRYGRLWWICKDGAREMYVYYTPTHWQPLPPPPAYNGERQ